MKHVHMLAKLRPVHAYVDQGPFMDFLEKALPIMLQLGTQSKQTG